MEKKTYYIQRKDKKKAPIRITLNDDECEMVCRIAEILGYECVPEDNSNEEKI